MDSDRDGFKVIFQGPRAPPNYNEVASSTRRQPATLDGVLETVHSQDSSLQLPQANPSDGYENVTFRPTLIRPPVEPATPLNNPRPDQSRRQAGSVPNMDEVAVRDALLCHVSQNVCWGLKMAREMNILDIIPSSAFKYKLETYTEKRMAVWCEEPFTDGVGERSDEGVPHGAWQVLVVPPAPFKKADVSLRVPNSVRIVDCSECDTQGRRRCWSCFGNGEVACGACNGTGNSSVREILGSSPTETQPVTRPCIQCSANGRRRCTVCLGPGQLACKTCMARGKLKLSLRLTVSWDVYELDRVVERTSVPEGLIRSVQHRIAFEEEGANLWPINFFNDEAVNHASRELLSEHRNRFVDQKVIAQKQSVTMIPIYQIAYEWNYRRGYFYIYGYDNFVYFPDYPQKICCGLRDVFPCNLC